MMRHYFSARPQVAHPGGMLLLAATGLLIAFACLPERLATCLFGAVAETVDLPAVAAAANDHFATALPAKEQTARPRLALRIVADAA
jgi:lauroyl/myristoyl acyltransferase